MDLLALYGPIVNWHSIEQCFCKKCLSIVRDKAQSLKNLREGRLKTKPLKILKEADIREIHEEICGRCREHCAGFTHLVGGREMQHVLTDIEINELIKEINRNELIEMLTI